MHTNVSILIFEFVRGRCLDDLQDQLDRCHQMVRRWPRPGLDEVVGVWQGVASRLGSGRIEARESGAELVRTGLDSRSLLTARALASAFDQSPLQVLEDTRKALAEPATVGLPTEAPTCFYHCLALAEKSLQDGSEGAAAEMVRARELLRSFALQMPNNFKHYEACVDALIADLDGQPERAQVSFDEAIRSAGANGFQHDMALCWEKKADSLHRRNLIEAAAAAYDRAARLFDAWGSRPSLDRLRRRYPDAPPSVRDSRHAGSHDVQSLFRMVEVLQVRQGREQALEQWMRLALESSGASRSVLLVRQGEVLSIRATAGLDGVELLMEPYDSYDELGRPRLPRSMIDSVVQGLNILRVADASQDERYYSDPYFKAREVQAVMCVPVIHLGAVLGVLYLEHSRYRRVFSGYSEEVARLLSMLGVTAIENARLYEELEGQVIARTRELRETQRRVVEQAHQAGMAETAAEILHDVGNALNSLNVALDAAVSDVCRLGGEELDKVLKLLMESDEEVLSVFRQDPTGKELMRFMSLSRDRSSGLQQGVLEKLGRAASKLDHIKIVVSDRVSIANSGGLIAEHCVRDLLDEAVRVVEEQAAKAKIKVRTSYHDQPAAANKISTDKHRVLRIMINLLTNAVQAHEASSEAEDRVIEIAVSAASHEVRIEVRDNGPGIPEDRLEEVFKRGFTSRSEGNGFGLHSSALAAQSLGGSLTAKSPGVLGGATVLLVLPHSARAVRRRTAVSAGASSDQSER